MGGQTLWPSRVAQDLTVGQEPQGANQRHLRGTWCGDLGRGAGPPWGQAEDAASGRRAGTG